MPTLSPRQRLLKRAFDLVLTAPALVVFAPVMLVAWAIAGITTGRGGLFRQERIGQDGEPFEVFKIRTMRSTGGSTVTTASDARITRAGAVMRRAKIDELPQLVNVLRGEMSLVGPRPDVAGYADLLEGQDRLVLTVRPGITSPAAVAYRHEEHLLANAQDAEAYNRDVLWPAKVRINREYVENWTLAADIRCLADTVRSVFDREDGGS